MFGQNVIWAGIKEGEEKEKLFSYTKTLHEHFAALGLVDSSFRFTPHITLLKNQVRGKWPSRKGRGGNREKYQAKSEKERKVEKEEEEKWNDNDDDNETGKEKEKEKERGAVEGRLTEICSRFGDFSFGTQTFDSLELLSMDRKPYPKMAFKRKPQEEEQTKCPQHKFYKGIVEDKDYYTKCASVPFGIPSQKTTQQQQQQQQQLIPSENHTK